MASAHSTSIALAVAAAVACAGGAVGCYVKSAALAEEAEWFLARGNAEGAQYTETFDGAFAEQQLVSFEKHREVLERAHRWQGLETALVLVCALAGLSAYAFFLLRRLAQQEITHEIAPARESAAVSAALQTQT